MCRFELQTPSLRMIGNAFVSVYVNWQSLVFAAFIDIFRWATLVINYPHLQTTIPNSIPSLHIVMGWIY
jgi:hypothetical protein